MCVHKEGPRSLVHEKEEDVSTLDEWKAVLAKNLLELKQLEGQDANTRIRRSLKEQEIGQHCRPGQEKVSAIPISPCSKQHWGSMNSNGTPTSPKSDPNKQKQMRQRDSLSCMQQQAEPHTSQRPQGDDHQKFESSTHGCIGYLARP